MSEDIFGLVHPLGYRRKFATCFVCADVSWLNADEVCGDCYLPSYRARNGPYTIAWHPGSSVIPDFVKIDNGLIVTRVVWNLSMNRD